MIMVNIELDCDSCAGRTNNDSQPNHCRRCGGKGFLRSTIAAHALTQMPVAPRIIGAFQTSEPPIVRRQKARTA